MKDCIDYDNGYCKADTERFGLPFRCLNDDYKDGKNYCVDYMTNPIKDNRIVNDTTFAVRLYRFVEQVDVCDMASEEEQEYLMRVAKDLYNYQVATATQNEEVDYLERVKL